MSAETIFASTWHFGKIAVEECWRHWQVHGNLERAVEAGTIAVELEPTVTSVGLGGLPNQEGDIQLDAAVMDGATLECGGVAGLRGIVPVVSVARKVMTETPHIMLVGADAENFALSQGFKTQELMTERSTERFNKWKSDRIKGIETNAEADSHDTVGVIGWHKGHGFVACSTSGYAWKLPGRVGDSPIYGAGLYADDEAGIAVATGYGEDIWRFALSSRVVELMRGGLPAQEACDEIIRFMCRRKSAAEEKQSAVMAISRQGDVGASCTQTGFDAQYVIDGEFSTDSNTIYTRIIS